MKARTAAGIGMILSSFAFFAAGGYVINMTLDHQERDARRKAETDRQCVRLLNTLPNVTMQVVGDDISLVMREVDDPRRAMTDITVAAMMCPGKKLVTACIGDGCEDAGGSVAARFRLEGAPL